MDLSKARVPYISKRNNVAVFGKIYNIGDIVLLNPNLQAHRVLIKNKNIVDDFDYNNCNLISQENGLNINGKIYKRGQKIEEKYTKINNLFKLLSFGSISIDLKKEETDDTKNEPTKVPNSVNTKETNKIKFVDISKDMGISYKDLILMLRKDEAIDKILGEKDPHHMAYVSDEISKLIDESSVLG